MFVCSLLLTMFPHISIYIRIVVCMDATIQHTHIDINIMRILVIYRISQLSSELCKNENYTDISSYQIYLIELHENILKYYRFNLFKEIPLDFSHSLQITLESPASPFDNFLVWIDKCGHYPCLQFILLQWVLFISCLTPP